MPRIRPLLIPCLLALGLPAHAEMYKWTDANGNVQFSDHKPAGTNAEAVHVETPKAPAPKKESGADKVLKQAEEAEKAREKRTQDARETARQQRWCNSARNSYRYWLDRRPYTFNQGTGDKVYTRDPSYEQRLRDAESYMKEQCNTP